MDNLWVKINYFSRLTCNPVKIMLEFTHPMSLLYASADSFSLTVADALLSHIKASLYTCRLLGNFEITHRLNRG